MLSKFFLGKSSSKKSLEIVVNLSVLVTLAFTQPLLSLLFENFEFFTVHKTTPFQFVAFTLIISIIPALLSISVLFIFRLLGGLLYQGLSHLFIIFLVALIVLPLVKYLWVVPAQIEVFISILVGFIFTCAYYFNQNLRGSLVYLSPVIVIFPLIFMLSPEARGLVFLESSGITVEGNDHVTTPVVLIIFDEFTINSVMNAEHKVDERNYPNLAWFSKQSHWYRNASTVADGTTHAIPSILSGSYGGDKLPNFQNYPDNLFSMLQHTHSFNVHESATQLCPKKLCENIGESKSDIEKTMLLLVDSMVLYLHIVVPQDYRGYLPDISQGWMNFVDGYQIMNRVELWRQFLNSISQSEKPSLNVLHILLPHTPLQYLPNGSDYKPRVIRGLSGETWGNDMWAVQQTWQRHLLQLAFVDNLLGELIRTLKSKNLFDESLVIITADHGVSFVPGDMRRPVTQTNYMDILPIPLFIKLPYQKQGSISDLNVESIDILPTILDVVKVSSKISLDGFSVFNTEKLIERKGKKVLSFRGGEMIQTYPAEISQKYTTVEKRLSLFPTGNLFALGSDGELVGENIDQFESRKSAMSYFETEKDVTSRLRKGTQGPNFIRGSIYGKRPEIEPIRLALSVNDTVEAVSKTFSLYSGNAFDFEFLVPDSAYTDQENVIKIYEIDGNQNDGYSLALLHGKRRIEYSINEKESGTTTLMDESGKRYQVVEGYLIGFLDELIEENGVVYYRGWAIDAEAQVPADQVVLYVDREFYASVRPRTIRPDVSKAYGGGTLKSGYHLVTDISVNNQICKGNFEIFALSKNGNASRLTIPKRGLHLDQLPGC